MLHDTKISNENYDKKATSYTYHGPFHNNVDYCSCWYSGDFSLFGYTCGEGEKRGEKSEIGLAIYIADLCNFIGTLSTT